MLPEILAPLRDAPWFGERRARAYRLILLVLMLLLVTFWVLGAHGGIDRMGKPLGTDFLAFWSAARLALLGEPAASYDLARIYAMERASMPVDPGLSSFLYPPPFLLLCLPFGLVGYFPALIAWLAATGATYWAVLHRWIGEHDRSWITILIFPANFLNIGHGQNGFLTAALLGGGLWLLDRRPFAAGLLLGLLVVKPQMALAVPVLVLFGGRWRTLAGGILSAATLCLISLLVFGSDAWAGFLNGGETARAIIEQGLVPYGKMISLSAAIHVLGGGSFMAYSAQLLLALGGLATLALACRSGLAAPRGLAALTAAATLLISPFMLDYDLTISAIPLAWLFSEGQRRGFLPWEKLVLAAAYMLPLYARDLALGLGVPIAPLVLAALFACAARAAMWRPEGAATFDFRSSPYRR